MNHDADRRRFLLGLATVCGGLLSQETLATGLSRYPRSNGATLKSGQRLNQTEMALLARLSDRIIPATDTPGALGTDTHGYIDDQLAHCVSPDEATLFQVNLLSFPAQCETVLGKPFQQLDDEALDHCLRSCAEAAQPFGTKGQGFFQKLKAMTMMGYYSSEIGASQELAYLRVPGGFDGDFKLAQIQKCWAT